MFLLHFSIQRVWDDKCFSKNNDKVTIYFSMSLLKWLQICSVIENARKLRLFLISYQYGYHEF